MSRNNVSGVFIGIDPGKKGAIAVLTERKAVVYPMTELEAALYENRGFNPVCLVEKQHNMPKQGAKQRASIARQAGFIEGLCAGLQISLEEVKAVDWQKIMLTNQPRQTREQRKESSIKVAHRLFPKVDLTMGTGRAMKDGPADALLIAEYGRRRGI